MNGRGTNREKPTSGSFASRASVAAGADRGGDGSDMARRVRDHDWAATPLGARQDWPQSLKCAVDLMLASRQPVCIAWGPDLLSLYNDGYIPILGSKHPQALGKPYHEVHAEVWEAFLPMLKATMAGHPQYVVDHPVPQESPAGVAIRYFTLAWTPLHNDAGKVAGFYCTATETTEKIRLQQARRESDTRHAFLLKLSDTLRPLAEPGAVQTTAARLLREHLHADCCAYFEVDAAGQITASYGIADDRVNLPNRLRITDFGQTLRKGFAAGQTLAVGNVATDPRFSDAEREPWRINGLSGGLGVPLVKHGRLYALLALSNVEPREWTGADVAMTEEVAERTWAAVERARAEEALRRSEMKYRTLFKGMDDGFCIIEMLFDADGKPFDYRFLETNPAFRHQTGLIDAVGRTVRDMAPEHETAWYERYGRIALTGEAERFENEAEALGHWYEVYAFRIGEPQQRQVAILFRDILERKRREHWLEEQTRLLELIASERSLDTVLRSLCDAVARLNGSAKAVVMFANEERTALAHTVTTQIPPSFGQGMMGAPINDLLVGTCGTAIHKGKPVTCTDIRSDERWSSEWRELCVAHGVLACYSTPVHDVNGVPRASMLLCFDQPHVLEPWERRLGEFAAHVASIAIQRERADRTLREGEQRLQLALDAAGMGAFVWYPEADRGVPDARLLQLLGMPPGRTASLTQVLATLIHPDDREAYAKAVAQACDPAGDGRLHTEVRVVRPDDSVHWLALSGQMLFDESRRAIRMVGAGADITEHKREAERRQVMIAELQHRTRNLIAVVRAISSQTLQNTHSLEHFRDEFDGRLQSLAGVQGLLSRSNEVPITVGALVDMELQALGAAVADSRMKVDGPPVRIRDSIAQTLAMAIHELAANARKYGALANDHGRLTVSWRLTESDDGRHVLIEWNEYGIDRHEPTQSHGGGYGRRLIEEALPYALEARTRYKLADGELHCSIELPLKSKSNSKEAKS